MSCVQRVLLCGHSLFIAGLQASLEVMPGVELQRVEAQTDRLQERLSVWKPDVLVLELDALQNYLPLSMLKDYPRLILVGLDTESDRLLVLTGQSARPLTIGELLQVIQQSNPLVSISRGDNVASQQEREKLP